MMPTIGIRIPNGASTSLAGQHGLPGGAAVIRVGHFPAEETSVR